MTAFFPALISVALMVLLGAIAGRTLSLEVHTLSQLSVYILAPALVADGLYRNHLSLHSAFGLLAGFTLISLILYLVLWGLGQILKLPPLTRKSLLATTLLPNNGNLGLPLLAFTLGEDGLQLAIIYMIGSSILLFGILPALLAGHSIRSGLTLTLKLPLMWAIAGGLGLQVWHLKLPANLEVTLNQLGQAAIPIALIILGLQLTRTRFGLGRHELGATALKLLLAPLIAYGVGILLHLQAIDLQVLILQTAMPTAVNTVVLVTEFGGDAIKVARTVVSSTLASLITLPFLLWATTQMVAH